MTCRAFVLLALLALLASRASAAPGASEVHTRAPLLGGEHLRLPTSRGAIHLWAPPGYDRRRAGVVLLAHGYGTSADRVWRDSRLAAQFRASGRNALFIVPDGPGGGEAPVLWPHLSELLTTVASRMCAELPTGPATVVGHSSGLRTVAAWLRDPRVREVVLLDGLYGQRVALGEWLAGDPRRRLLLVAARTRSTAESWVRGIPRARQLAYVPRVAGELTAVERAAPLLYLRSQYQHTEMLQRPVVLPLALRIAAAH